MSIEEKLHGLASNQGVVELVEKTATKISYGAGASSVFLGFTVEEWGVIGIVGGLIFSAATFGFNVWFKLRYMSNKRNETNNQ